MQVITIISFNILYYTKKTCTSVNKILLYIQMEADFKVLDLRKATSNCKREFIRQGYHMTPDGYKRVQIVDDTTAQLVTKRGQKKKHAWACR